MNLDLDKLRSQLSGLPAGDFKLLYEGVIAEHYRRRPTVTPKPKLMRSFDEYQTERLNSEEELPALKRELVANGRQFRLTDAQLYTVEQRVGKLAHREVSIYNASWNATDDQLMSFAMQVLLPRNARRRSGCVTAAFIKDADRFFLQVSEKQKQLDEAEVENETKAAAKPKKVKKPSVSKSAKDLLEELGL